MEQELLLLSRTLTACQQGKVSSRSPRQPSWKNVQALTYSVFETLQSLLSVPSFVAVTQELLEHQVRALHFLVEGVQVYSTDNLWRARYAREQSEAFLG